MILLTGTSQSLFLNTSSSQTISVSVSAVDITSTGFTPVSQESAISSATNTQILGSPAASTQRQVKLITVVNTGSGPNTVGAIKLNGSQFSVSPPNIVLQAGEALQFVDGEGWSVLGTDGVPKASGLQSYALLNGVNPFTGGITLAAGSTTLSPLKFQSGTLNTTAVVGAYEFDGTVFTSSVGAGARGLAPSVYFMNLATAYTLTSATTAQKLLNVTTNGAITLPVGTYEFECDFSLTGMSATSGSFGFALGGTATITQSWWAMANKVAAAATATAPQTSWNSAANTALATANTNTAGYAIIKGTIRVTVAGTVIPQVSLGVAAAAVVGVNSYFRITTLGAAAVASLGNWS